MASVAPLPAAAARHARHRFLYFIIAAMSSHHVAAFTPATFRHSPTPPVLFDTPVMILIDAPMRRYALRTSLPTMKTYADIAIAPVIILCRAPAILFSPMRVIVHDHACPIAIDTRQARRAYDSR